MTPAESAVQQEWITQTAALALLASAGVAGTAAVRALRSGLVGPPRRHGRSMRYHRDAVVALGQRVPLTCRLLDHRCPQGVLLLSEPQARGYSFRLRADPARGPMPLESMPFPTVVEPLEVTEPPTRAVVAGWHAAPHAPLPLVVLVSGFVRTLGELEWMPAGPGSPRPSLRVVPPGDRFGDWWSGLELVRFSVRPRSWWHLHQPWRPCTDRGWDRPGVRSGEDGTIPP